MELGEITLYDQWNKHLAHHYKLLLAKGNLVEAAAMIQRIIVETLHGLGELHTGNMKIK